MKATILDCVGHTPMVALQKIARGRPYQLYAKCEFLNPGGSGKDRIARAIVEAAEAGGRLSPGATIIEATAGNTGIGLAIVAAVKGYHLVCCMPDKMAEGKRRALRAAGAELILCPNVPLDHPENFQNKARALAEERGWFHTDQFAHAANPSIHERTTGPEILEQCSGRLCAFVAGAGTGGTLTGVGRYLKSQLSGVRIVLADPFGSRLSHFVNPNLPDVDFGYQLEGIGSSCSPKNLDLSVVDDTVRVSDEEAFRMTRELIREEGLLVGGSSGAAVAAAIHYADEHELRGSLVVLLADSWDRYFSTHWIELPGGS